MTIAAYCLKRININILTGSFFFKQCNIVTTNTSFTTGKHIQSRAKSFAQIRRYPINENYHYKISKPSWHFQIISAPSSQQICQRESPPYNINNDIT